MTEASFRFQSPRKVMSPMFPMGVATIESFPCVSSEDSFMQRRYHQNTNSASNCEHSEAPNARRGESGVRGVQMYGEHTAEALQRRRRGLSMLVNRRFARRLYRYRLLPS